MIGSPERMKPPIVSIVFPVASILCGKSCPSVEIISGVQLVVLCLSWRYTVP